MAVATTYGGEAGAIRTAVLALRRETHLPVAFGGAMGTGRRLRLTELNGAATDSLRGLVVTPGSGLGGKTIALARPLAVADYESARSISHEYDGPVGAEGLRSIVAVPVVGRRGVRAVLYGALRCARPLGDRVVSAAVGAARGLERDLAAHDEVQRRLGTLDLAAAHLPERGAGGREWEEVRRAHAELRTLAQRSGDPELRTRLHRICARLAGAGGPPGPAPAPRLSPRELDVLACVALGGTNAEAAERLGLRPETVKSYLRTAMRKLDSHTRMEAVVAARRAGLLP
ncbi:DNA-binding CsgD family transcriptional regulator [Spinactinospora alkalitolerans]|uniref:DNA-binding CsgD family transcriptional regulator n=1 Tax=Spinactinospora alkalitolerans TaxID=687207 RepID=A0A852TRA5_9ACTN|nr:LuxR C-terminal-related transcriptional regulator [Spinactinospora alkalitolerans]NYE46926.1 DNA-binding CsgD family transcriptional regulator [Spinactinospora alkalitolerans]